MFSGIIRNVGSIKSIHTDGNIILELTVGPLASQCNPGDSICVDGVCLTVIKTGKDTLVFELIPQTWKLTRFSRLKAGDRVNLEKSLTLKDYIDGHLLMGHVDGVGKIIEIVGEKNLRQVKISPPKDLIKFIALRGAIAVNGVSLTVSHLDKTGFGVSLTEYTIDNTNFGDLKEGGVVNLEIDMISRYLDNLLKSYER